MPPSQVTILKEEVLAEPERRSDSKKKPSEPAEASGEAEQSENLFPDDKPAVKNDPESLEKPLSNLKLESDSGSKR